MQYQYDVIFYIGRFEPFHLGHFLTVHKALSLAKKVVLIVGSIDEPRSIKNPWTYPERTQMIYDSFRSHEKDRIFTIGVRNHMYNDEEWIAEIQSRTKAFTNDSTAIGLIGYKKDFSSRYLDWFPQWTPIPVDEIPVKLNATDIRRNYFSSNFNEDFKKSLTIGSLPFLDKFLKNPVYKELQLDWVAVEEYQKKWGKGPFLTVDAVVITTGHVLMVKRSERPNLGLLALPGGFLEPDETMLAGALRELDEETKLKIPDGVLSRGVKTKFFDHPDRSLRARIVTNAHLFYLEPEVIHERGKDGMPKIRASNEIKHAMWVKMSDFDMLRNQVYEDHWDIIKYLQGLI